MPNNSCMKTSKKFGNLVRLWNLICRYAGDYFSGNKWAHLVEASGKEAKEK